jgi:hypothetical protein
MNGMIGSGTRALNPKVGRDQTVPTERILDWKLSRHFMPGYHRKVPSGQKLTAGHEIGATSPLPYGFDPISALPVRRSTGKETCVWAISH